MEEQGHQRFFIGFEDDCYLAFPVDNRDRYSRRNVLVADGLEELLQKCRDAGFTQFEGLTEDAVDVIYDWLTRGKPVVEFVESLWGEQSTASRRIGFRVPKPDDSAC